MPANKSYDVFLLEKGTKFTLISQLYHIIQTQPTLTLNRHDTILYISKTIHKVLDETCNNILASKRIDCIRDKAQEFEITSGNFCLPFQYNTFFPKWHSAFPQCNDDKNMVFLSIKVNI